MVRLKASVALAIACVNDKFQFQNGAIKSEATATGIATVSCFNSKMVRLKEPPLISF